jgi:hypothetical protein
VAHRHVERGDAVTVSIDWHTAACILAGLIAYVLLRRKR